jgi:hypothetical protein
MHFRRFEEMPVWQDARKLTSNVGSVLIWVNS